MTMLSLFRHSFVEDAFAAGAVIAILAAIIGYFVVLRAQAFAAHVLSVVGFAGATGAAVIGISALPGMIAATLFTAFTVGLLEQRIANRDVEIGMVLSFVLGLGVMFLSIYQNSATEAMSVLFGSLLSVTAHDIILLIVLGLVSLAGLTFIFRPLLFCSVDPEMAEARGVRVKLISMIFLLLLAITVAEAVQVVGVLLVFALLIAPPAAAQHIVRRPAAVIVLSMLLGLAFTWGGLILAVLTPYPVSFYITALAAVTYLVVVNVSHRIRPHRFHEMPHPDREFVDHTGHQHAHDHHHQ